MKRSYINLLLAVVTTGALLLAACSSPTATLASQPSPTSPAPSAYPNADMTATASNSGYPAETETQASSAPATVYPAPTTSPAGSGAITLTDGLNRTVTLPAPAKTVVSLAASNTEILYAIGAGSLVVGRDDFSDYPDAAKAVASIGGSNGKYNLEAITQLKPDLILAAGLNTPDQVKALEGLNLTVFYLANPTDVNGMFNNLETVAKMVGKEAETSQLVTGLKARYDVVIKALAGVTIKPKVYYELDATDPTKPYTAGPGSYVDQLITAAGGVNVGAALSEPWAAISQEEIIAQNPDVIMLGDAAYGTTIASVGTRPGWGNLNAVKNQKVFTFDDNTVSRPGPRMIDGLEIMAKLIHPEAFK